MIMSTAMYSISLKETKSFRQIMNSEDHPFDNINDFLSYQEIHTHDLYNLKNVLSNFNINSQLIVTHFNLRSLNANLELLEAFITALQQKPHNYLHGN